MTMLLLADPRVRAIPVVECREPLVALDERFGPGRALVRAGLAQRLASADALLASAGAGVRLRVVEGYRPAAAQRAIIAAYTAQVRIAHPSADTEEVARLTSRFVAPIGVAPHVAGAAVDVTLVNPYGEDLDLGTPIDATPEQSGGACYFAAPGLAPTVRANREELARVLGAVGLVNYPTEWWHWSYGDRYWALLTGAPVARYGPLADGDQTRLGDSGPVPAVEAPARSGARQ